MRNMLGALAALLLACVFPAAAQEGQPRAACFPFKDAIKLANDTPFGLAAYVFSQNLGRAWRVAERLDAGMVGVNEGIFSNEVVPFGGVKESGLGREGAAEGLDEYLEIKYICLGGIDA